MSLAVALIVAGCDAEQSSAAEEANEDALEPAGAERMCERDDACGQGGLCEVYDCGGRPARFNHFGCERIPCDANADCPSGEACFAIAFDRICEPSTIECGASQGECLCDSTTDCEGIFDAHCLPIEFYPPAEYCDPAAWTCDALPEWVGALERAATHRSGTALGEALGACATLAVDTREDCR